MHDLGFRRQGIRAEENRGAEDPFECGNQSAILPSTLAHAEGIQHLGSGPESNGLAFLLNGQCREKDWDDAVFTKRHSVIGMTSDLKDKLTVPSLVEELAGGQWPEGQPAEYERP